MNQPKDKDPVCEMIVDTGTANFMSTYQGKTYYFCSDLCRQLFNREPFKYVPPLDGQSGIKP